MITVRVVLIAGLIFLSSPLIAQNRKDSAFITVDLKKEIGPMKPVWAWFGYDEPNYTYMKDGKKLLSEIASLSSGPVYIRTHNLLTTGDGQAALKWGSTNAYTEDAQGRPVYDWTIVDRIFDTYIQQKLKPLAQFGFMPEALSSKPQPYRHHWEPGKPYSEIYTGWTYPPRDYAKWSELVYQWVTHAVKRYGKEEVLSWKWELWNEPNLPYWGGTVDEYCKLYDYTVAGAQRALAGITIGGPDSTGPSWDKAEQFLRAFLTHCTSGKNYVTGKQGSHLDFVAFHAKGAPKIIDGGVRMNMGTQLRDIAKGFEIISSYPSLKNLPVIIGESDPEGCAACGMHTNPENAYRNGTMYSSYTAASFARKYELADYYKINLTGVVSWSFEFEDQPWFYGFRDLATNGVDKPVLNIFRMFGLMKGNRIEAVSNHTYSFSMVRDSSIRKQNDVGALASRSDHTASVMIWNYHDDDLRPGNPIPNANVKMTIRNTEAKRVLVTHYRIDDKLSNSYSLWKKLGSPENPTLQEIDELQKAGQLQIFNAPQWITVSNGQLQMLFDLPLQGVTLIKIDW